MPQDIIYDNKSYTGFDADWRPHRKVSDFWLAQGMIHESDIPEAVYAFHLALRRVAAGRESFYRVGFSLGDILNHKTYDFHICVPHIAKTERFDYFIDEDSIICAQHAQMMRDRKAMALRLRSEDFGLDLCLERTMPEVPKSGDGRLFLTKSRNPRHSLRGCTLPRLKAGGRIHTPEGSLRIEGMASFERLWGKYPLKRAAAHWERFYLFFDNGDEISITEFPYGKHHAGDCFPLKHKPFSFSDFEVEAVEYTEVDDWRFASAWRLLLPHYSRTTFYLLPLIPEAIRLPISYPVMGIFDQDSNRLGYAAVESMPGARNELDKIPPGMFAE